MSKISAGKLKTENPRFLFTYLKQVCEDEQAGENTVKINKEKYVNAIILAGEGEWIYRLALEFEGMPIDRLQKGLIKSGSAIDMFYFAKNIEGADVPKLAEEVAKTRDANACFLFMRNIAGYADNSKLEDVILKYGNAEQLFKYAKFVKKGSNTELDNCFIYALQYEIAKNQPIAIASTSNEMVYVEARQNIKNLSNLTIRYIQEISNARENDMLKVFKSFGIDVITVEGKTKNEDNQGKGE